MFGLIFSGILLIAGLSAFICLYFKKVVRYKRDNDGELIRDSDYNRVAESVRPYKFVSTIIAIASVVLAAVIICISCIATVPTGHTGVVTSFGKVENYTFDSGVHFIAPWKKVVKMDNRVQKSTVELSCFSSDIQEVDVTYTINYQINKATAQDLYRSVGENYFNTVIVPNINECVKASVAKYTAEDLVNERSDMALMCESLLADQLKAYNIDLVSTSVENLDFTDAFTDAVEAKQVAQQNKLKAITEQEQKTAEEQAAADRAIITATADAEVARIQAEADAEVAKIQADANRYAGEQEAEVNKAISSSLTADIIRYYYIQHWNGILPETYVGSDDVSTIIGMD